ncbi:MAG TPA: type I glutamate--ammonia ligase [Candidatus Sumerlaeota bacterium]|nr:MAG: Glutamine synthetase [candidate division BRC1 bacterium ADurb.BinA292]HOE97551.1 type I glutamate--ammonia ligase [Candidatus Sumerlaeota bacterium]HOR27181.1 type I glutamate--ammonia ligase [Candidatus Sumerlaeota bacterium]HPK01101.1 type I glutamate--ammonia ligase [Candidatus Sumerlaeota bacterium]
MEARDCKTPKDVIQVVKEKGIKVVDYKFMDFPGLWQHFSQPAWMLEEETFSDGVGFDGSSIRGWQAIHESDMLLIPDPMTALIDPFCQAPTLSLVCNVVHPGTMEKYTRDPRNIALKAEAYLKSTGIGDTCYIGPEAEFFIFDDVRFDSQPNQSFYLVDSIEGRWNTGRDEGPNLGYKPRYKEGYFPCPPADHFQDLRTEMMLTMIDCGIPIEAQHHEVATGGQAEIDMRFAPLTHQADCLLLFKYIIKNTARKYGKTVTFMPKPLYGDNGSGMHTHISVWKDGKNLFAGKSYAGLSELALHFIGGLIKHAPSILAFAAPSTNSYKRLVPGYEAPVNLAYSQRNRSAACRIPMYSPSEKAKRVEFRPPDPSCNPYLTFSAMLMAGLDGIQNKLDPGDPLDKNLYDLPPEEAKLIKKVPGSLDEALAALEADHDYLLKGDVFTEDVIDEWISYKTKMEIDAVRMRPHPYEFHLYYDI